MYRNRTWQMDNPIFRTQRNRILPIGGDTGAPSAPVIVKGIQNGAGTIDVAWTSVPGASSYTLEYSTDAGASWSVVVSQAGTTYSQGGLSYPGSYTYRVEALVGATFTAYSPSVTETMVDVPAQVGGLTVTGATTSSISLSWNDTADEDSYQIEASVDGFGPWSVVGNTGQNVVTFTHSGLAESVQRYYRVTALNKAGGGLPSSTANSWTVPAAPTGLTATAASPTQIDLSWTDVSTGNQSYKVERSTDNTNWTEIATGLSATATTYSATGLSGATQYWFRVRAANAARNSNYSSTATATTTLAAPSGLTATATSSTQINLSWTDNSANEDGFKVERSTDNSTWTEIAGNVAANSTTYSATGLTASTLYYFRVRAYRGAVNSSYTSSASATTQSGALTPSWTLDFSSGEPWANGTNYVFSSTASTTRTFVNSSGYVAPSVANLVPRSEEFNTTWSAARMTVTANSVTAPDNTTTADTITEDTSTNTHGMYQSIGVTSGASYTLSCYIKKGTRRYVCVGFWDTTSSNSGAQFDMDTNTATAVWGTGYSASSNATMTDVGNGWYRCSVTCVAKATTDFPSVTFRSTASTAGSGGSIVDSYAGSTANYAYVWGFQMEAGTAALPYSKTTTSSNGIPRLTHNSSGSRLGLLVEGQRTNRAQKSDLYDNTVASTTTRTTVTSIVIPSGSSGSASKISGSNLNAGAAVYYTENSLASGDYAMSVYAKADGANFLYVSHITSSTENGAYFDLSNGTVGNTVGTILGTRIENAGNGWYRCIVTWNNTTAQVVYPALLPSTTNATGRSSQVGTSPDGVLVWGVQYEAAASASSYVANTGTGTTTRSADLVHVLDSSITSWGDPGALVVHFYPPGQAGRIISTDAAATAQVGIEASTTTAARAFWSSSSTSTGTIGSSVQKAVHYWNGSTSKFAINGGTVQSGTNNFTIANADFVTLGAEATDSSGVPGTFSQYANCIIRKVEFYSGTLTDANLQTITGPTSYNVEYLVVAGGGGSGSAHSADFGGGGGGGGGFRTASGFTLTPGTSYTITVGAGGSQGSSGSNSVFSSITSTGGGRGGNALSGAGASGGSGGGGASTFTAGVFPAGGAGTSGQGNAGGAGFERVTSDNIASGGGGGAGAAAANATSGTGSAGGAGSASSISGASVTYAGGGGGGAYSGTRGSGGSGGGGAGGKWTSTTLIAVSGTANSGGGGGAGNTTYQASGGSGVVIIRMPTANYSGVHTPATVTTSGSDTILTFTSSGNYVA